LKVFQSLADTRLRLLIERKLGQGSNVFVLCIICLVGLDGDKRHTTCEIIPLHCLMAYLRTESDADFEFEVRF
jgi:hypothetical protein